jgi:hypothetical protein
MRVEQPTLLRSTPALALQQHKRPLAGAELLRKTRRWPSHPVASAHALANFSGCCWVRTAHWR